MIKERGVFMEKGKLYKEIYDAVLDGNKERAVHLAQKSIEMGLEPKVTIEEAYTPALREAGRLWEEGEFFLPELVLSSDAVKGAMEVFKPLLERGKDTVKIGTVVIGTIEGDIHDIGKSLVASLLLASGFDVYDLGVDVPPDKFIEEALKRDADIIGISALLTTTMVGQRKVIELLQERGIRSRFKVMVGGAPVSYDWAKSIGADASPQGAGEAVQIARKLISIRG